MIYCRQCGAENPSDANYCHVDGHPLEPVVHPPYVDDSMRESCHYCGAWREGDSSYCHVCGESFARFRTPTFTAKRAALSWQQEPKRALIKSLLMTLPFVVMLFAIMIAVSEFVPTYEDDQSNVLTSGHNVLYEYGQTAAQAEGNLQQFRREETLVNRENVDSMTIMDSDSFLTWREKVLISHGLNFEQSRLSYVPQPHSDETTEDRMETTGTVAMPHYTILLMVLAGVSGWIYRRMRSSISLTSMAMSAVSFIAWYAVPLIVLISLTSGSFENQEESRRVGEMAFSFSVDSSFVSLMLLLGVMFFLGQLWQEKRALPYWLEGVKHGGRWFALIVGLFVIGGLIIIGLSMGDESFLMVEMQSYTIFGVGIVVVAMSMLLINIGLLNPLTLQHPFIVQEGGVDSYRFHLFNQSVESMVGEFSQSEEEAQRFLEPIVDLGPWYWFSFLMLILLCVLIGFGLQSSSWRVTLSLAVGIALTFTVLNSLFVQVMNHKMMTFYNENEHVRIVMFEWLTTVGVTFSFVFVFVMMGVVIKRLWKGDERYESNRS
ncbi:hypothetical protein ABID56_001434 [Alkalibacillus flavidus]|uniref:Zinc ribbon domain-containing protein n=1 Tax=Alkalibacillus flavidus TaxID=546021 RepID=A0ABV2KUT0_9BACI